ncbi:ATP-binding protein, partial [Acinetobacter baumannii]
ELPMVFDRYYRGGDHDARPAGAGLGLTIARAFVEAGGGGLPVERAGVGHGATFRINLPAAGGRA